MENEKGNENYFEREENEFQSINFMSVSKNQVYNILAKYEGNYLMKLVYFSE